MNNKNKKIRIVKSVILWWTIIKVNVHFWMKHLHLKWAKNKRGRITRQSFRKEKQTNKVKLVLYKTVEGWKLTRWQQNHMTSQTSQSEANSTNNKPNKDKSQSSQSTFNHNPHKNSTTKTTICGKSAINFKQSLKWWKRWRVRSNFMSTMRQTGK